MRRNPKSLSIAVIVGLTAVAMVAGCSTGGRKSGQYMDDKHTSHKVKDGLGHNPIYKFDEVSVTTYRGVVQLNGWIEKPEQKQVAENIAKGTPGVLDVVNNLTLKPHFEIVQPAVQPTGQSKTGRAMSEQQYLQQQEQQLKRDANQPQP